MQVFANISHFLTASPTRPPLKYRTKGQVFYVSNCNSRSACVSASESPYFLYSFVQSCSAPSLPKLPQPCTAEVIAPLDYRIRVEEAGSWTQLRKNHNGFLFVYILQLYQRPLLYCSPDALCKKTNCQDAAAIAAIVEAARRGSFDAWVADVTSRMEDRVVSVHSTDIQPSFSDRWMERQLIM